MRAITIRNLAKGRGHRATAFAIALLGSTSAYAQTTPAPAPEAEEPAQDIVVTGSRIERAGFDQPTPTTVVGELDLRQGARPNIQQILNDQPQVRPSTTPQVSVGNTSAGTAPVDLRGLGSARTLTLLNGRRFSGENNLNFLPVGLVQRLEIVTGGASAAWGSGAVAGVVNIILKDHLEGFSVGGQTGVSTRGDGQRYGGDATFGTSFADGRAHFIAGVEYLTDKGVLDRNSRPNLGSAGIVRVAPGTTDLRTQLVRDVNYGNQTASGLITTGILAGQVFNQDGTLRPFRAGQMVGTGFAATMIGGADGINLYDDVVAASPYDRLNAYSRLSYDIGGATIWVDGIYGRSKTDGKFAPDFTLTPFSVSATNPFLSQTIRNQLATAGQTSFTFGRVFNDIFLMNFNTVRTQKEGAIGIDGTFGKSFKYSAHYSHGEVSSYQRVENSRLAANFTKAINAVSSGGQIVCAVNADAITTNDDPACRPLNPFGSFNESPESVAYVRGTQQSWATSKLDAAGAEIQGDLFSLWAGPITVAVGGEARWEEQSSSRGAQDIAGVFAIPLFTSDLAGGFNVKEGFGEIAAPILDVEGKLKVDLNGAARYSDYSNSGGIWSWKGGGTVRLFNDLLLRATRSKDIRAPGIGDLYAVRRINVGPLTDQDSAGRTSVPGYNANPATVTTYSGGNPDLKPEISKTLTFGATFSPSFIRGLNLSVDYYDVSIDGAITTLSAQNLTLACKNGSSAACARVIRNPTTQTVETVFSNAQNVARFETKGVDMEISYQMPLSNLSANMPGSLRFRALATYVDSFVLDNGVTRVDTAGDVGDATGNSLPKWRGSLSINYQDKVLGVDLRARYVDGGAFNHLNATLINNTVDSRTYVDLGVRFNVDDKFSLFGNVNNLFDVDPPISTVGNTHYDIMGTYVTVGARVNF